MKPFLQRSFISPQECETLMKYQQHRSTTNGSNLIHNKNGKFYTLVGDPLTDAIGLVYKDRLESILNKKLSLSYSYLKRSTRGCYMPWHKNRWECEYVVAIQCSWNEWPIYFLEDQDSPLIEGEQDNALELIAQQGDAVIFCGADSLHARRPLKSLSSTTLSLNYVEKDGYLDNMDNSHETTSLNYLVDFGDVELSATMYDNDFARNWFKVDKIDNGNIYGHGNGINNIIAAANAGEATAIAILRGTNVDPVEIKLKNNNRAYTNEGTDLKLRYSTDNQTLTMGYRDTEDSEDRFQVYATTPWLGGKLGSLVVGSDPGYSSNNRLTTAEATAFYVNEEVYFGDLTLNLGFRSEEWTIVQERYVDAARSAINIEKGYPKVLSDNDNSLMGFGAIYDMNDTTQLFFGFHEGFTPTGGGADPEQADNIEMGVRYTNDSTYMEAVYFDTDYQNMFGECTASGGATGSCEIGDSFNAGEASISGIELVVQTEMVSTSGVKYPFSVVYTSTDAEFDNTFDSDFWGSVTAGMEIPDLPDSQLALQAGFETQNGLSGNATLYSYGSTCSVASCASGTEVDSYRVIDASLTKTMNEDLDVYMVISNITDETDVIARAPKNGARAQMPRSFIVGIRYRL